jgi:tetratricopeptide (TPR) repeat protein
MRVLLIYCFLLTTCFGFAQSDDLAKQYFDRGDFSKALSAYSTLYNQHQNKLDYFLKIIDCHQQLENYTEAGKLIQNKIKQQPSQMQLHIVLGENYERQQLDSLAQYNYDIALNSIDNNPRYAYLIGATFQQYSKLRYALKTFQKAMQMEPSLNLNLQVARLYGEIGEIENMYSSYLDLILQNEAYRASIERNLIQYVTDDPYNENNILLRKLLLKKLQQNPNILWNEFLSWLFIQQKQYEKAFVQEKAIYKRGEPSFQRIIDLAFIAKDDKDNEAVKEIMSYVLTNDSNPETILMANQVLLQIAVEEASTKEYEAIENTFNTLLSTYGKGARTLNLQMDYAQFLAFNKGNTTKAISVLKECLNPQPSRFQAGEIKLVLGDILVYDEKFNQALIYFSQVQKTLKNNIIGQQARFKVAQTSYFKGDFEWAQTQLKVLRSSTTQLIANDAMELSLLISDNSHEDSLQIALKKFAKADLLAYQKKNIESIAILEDILQQHKGDAIEDEALLKQAELYILLKEYPKAVANYQLILETYSDGILADNALFGLATLYNEVLAEPEKAKEYYEQIIFKHPDSIFFVEARKKYRILRGDSIN